MITVYCMTKDPLYELHDANCISLGKRAKKHRDETDVEAFEYYKKCFLAEHSTMDVLMFRVIDDHCRSDITHQITRATEGRPRFVVQSSRPDWNNGEERKPSDKTFVNFSCYFNATAWLNICRERLCNRAMTETHNWVSHVLAAMEDSNDPMLRALADICVPQCVYRGGTCYETKGCGMHAYGYKKCQ